MQDQQRLAKKMKFLFKTCFPTNHLQFTKESFVFPGVTGCVKSVQIQSYFWSVFSCTWIEYRKIRTRNNSVFGHFSRSVIVTEDKTDNFASYETIESSKQVISNNLFLSEFLNERYTMSKLMMSYKGNS